MKVITRTEDATVVLEPKSALVGRATDDLADAFKRTLESEKFDVTIDLKSVPLVDSAALEALLRFTEQCDKMGGRCTLTNPGSKINTILRVTRLERELNIA